MANNTSKPGQWKVEFHLDQRQLPSTPLAGMEPGPPLKTAP